MQLIRMSDWEGIRYPGARYRHLGPNSAEACIEDFITKQVENLPAGSSVVINLDGAIGYPGSWVSEFVLRLSQMNGIFIFDGEDVDTVHEFSEEYQLMFN